MSIEELQKEVVRLREENRLLQFAKTRSTSKDVRSRLLTKVSGSGNDEKWRGR